jgi:hypothetical protein
VFRGIKLLPFSSYWILLSLDWQVPTFGAHRGATRKHPAMAPKRASTKTAASFTEYSPRCPPVVPALQTQRYPICFHGVRLDDASFYHSTCNNLHHQSMVVCLGVLKVKEHVLECEDNVEASYYTSCTLSALK